MDNEQKSIFSDIEAILRGKTGRNLEIGIVTAENEMGRRLPDTINNKRNEVLAKKVRQIAGARFYRIQGNFGGIDENSFLTIGIPLEVLKSIANEFKRQAFIYGNGEDDDMIFHYMEIKDDDSDHLDYESVQIRRTFVYKPTAEENYSSYKGIKFVIPFFDSDYTDVRWEELSSEEQGELTEINGEENNGEEDNTEMKKSEDYQVKKGSTSYHLYADEDLRNLLIMLVNKGEATVTGLSNLSPEEVVDSMSMGQVLHDIKKAGYEVTNMKNNESHISKIKGLIESLKIDEKAKVKIKVKHSDLLEIPEGKKFWSMPFKHYTDLVDKKGYAKVIRALNNIKTWNKNDDPSISTKADTLMDKLKKKYRPEED